MTEPETHYEKLRRLSAFWDGVKSRRQGQTPDQNPYTHDTDPSRHSWTLGWFAGEPGVRSLAGGLRK